MRIGAGSWRSAAEWRTQHVRSASRKATAAASPLPETRGPTTRACHSEPSRSVTCGASRTVRNSLPTWRNAASPLRASPRSPRVGVPVRIQTLSAVSAERSRRRLVDAASPAWRPSSTMTRRQARFKSGLWSAASSASSSSE